MFVKKYSFHILGLLRCFCVNCVRSIALLGELIETE